MTQHVDPEDLENPSAGAVQDDSTLDPDLDQLAETGEVSIDDALEADRVAAEGADSRTAGADGVDADRERGADDTVAAEQGNRDEDRMEIDAENGQLDRIAGSDGDAAGTDRDLADPEA